MTEQMDNLVLVHLRHIRSRMDQIADHAGDLKQRMSGLESAMNLARRGVAPGDEIDARSWTSTLALDLSGMTSSL